MKLETQQSGGMITIYPYIPQNKKQYYTEPCGGALQPRALQLLPSIRKVILDKENTNQGMYYQHLIGGLYLGCEFRRNYDRPSSRN